MPALYLPVMLMLLALILRGVAFEFRLHGRARGKRLWTAAFAGGSLAASLAQGLILGGFIQGVRVSPGTPSPAGRSTGRAPTACWWPWAWSPATPCWGPAG